jgi:hypothetical protein
MIRTETVEVDEGILRSGDGRVIVICVLDEKSIVIIIMRCGISITYELLSHAIERSNNIVSLFKELENIRINA